MPIGSVFLFRGSDWSHGLRCRLGIVFWKAGRDHQIFARSPRAEDPSPLLQQRIVAAINDLGLDYVTGTTWTIDAPYRETVAEVSRYREEGVLTVEMEAAALFAIAQYHNFEAGAIFTISDYLGELEWEPHFHLVDDHLQQLFLIAKKVLSLP